MSTKKNILSLVIRLGLTAIAMSFAYLLSETVIRQTDLSMTPEEARWAEVALFIVSTINALLLAYPILRSRWHGLKLVCVVFLVQFGVETFMTQIETLYFNRAIQMDATVMTRLVVAGALRALIFAPLAVWLLGKMVKNGMPGNEQEASKLPLWGLRLAGLAVLYPVVYFLFGYYVAWQWEATRLFYTGMTTIQPFITHFKSLFSSDPYILLFQLMRGLFWSLLAWLIVRMMKTRRWETALAVALIFSGLLCSGIGLFPNPFMPLPVRMSHFYEILSSMLLFGCIAGWVLHPSMPAKSEQTIPVKEVAT